VVSDIVLGILDQLISLCKDEMKGWIRRDEEIKGLVAIWRLCVLSNNIIFIIFYFYEVNHCISMCGWVS
jgi:hypothetical protein